MRRFLVTWCVIPPWRTSTALTHLPRSLHPDESPPSQASVPGGRELAAPSSSSSLSVAAVPAVVAAPPKKKKVKKTAAERLLQSVQACVKCRDVDGAMRLVQDGLGLSPTRPTTTAASSPSTAATLTFSWAAFTALLYLCETSGRAAEALALVDVIRCLQQQQPGLGGELEGKRWETNEKLLAVILRLQCAVGDEVAATHLFTYLLQQNILRRRSASIYLRFCCQLTLEEEHHAAALMTRSGRPPKTGADPTGAAADRLTARLREKLSRSNGVFAACQQRQIPLDVGDLTALGRLWATLQQPLSALLSLLRVLRENELCVDDAFVSQVLRRWRLPPDPAAGLPPSQELSVRTVHISRGGPPLGNPKTALVRCPHCHGSLLKQPFTPTQLASLLADVEQQILCGNAARGGGEGGGKRASSSRAAAAKSGFRHWKRLLQQSVTQGTGFDLLIDGANIGYYGLSKWYGVAKLREEKKNCEGTAAAAQPEMEDAAKMKAKEAAYAASLKDLQQAQKKGRGGGVDVELDFGLINEALRVAREEYHFLHPLILLHSRHTREEGLSATNAAHLEAWRVAGVVYETPRGVYDDGFWLYGALFLSCAGAVPPTQTETSLPPPLPPPPPHIRNAHTPKLDGVYVLTNDWLRDHHFQLLSPRCFTRWREHYCIRFHCQRVEDVTHMCFDWPPPYSHTAQEAEAKNCWHLPMIPTPAGAAKSSSVHSRGDQPPEPEDPAPGRCEKDALLEQETWVCLTYT